MTVNQSFLENKLQIATDNMASVSSVAVSLWVKVGSRFETSVNMGLSHFLEHMAFKGTKTRTAFDIAKQFDDIGGNFNATTDREHTVYYAKVLKKDINIALDIFGDIILNSQFPDDEIDREKGVVLQEICETNDSPAAILHDKYMEVAYSEQSFGHSILGTPESVKNFSKQQIIDYVSEHYVGENMILAAAGNIEHEELLAISAPYFDKVVSKKVNKIESSAYVGGQYFEERDLEQVNFMIGFPGLSRTDDKIYTIQVFDSILGGGMSSRLFQEVREKLGLAYSIYSFHSGYSDTGIFSIYTSSERDNLYQLISIIAREVKLMMSGVTQDEVERAKMKLIAEVLMSGENTGSRAQYLGCSYSCHHRYITKEEIIKKISAVSAGEVMNIGRQLLSHHQKLTVAAIGPLDKFPSHSEIVQLFS